MQELGAELLLVCSNVSESAVDDDALAASSCAGGRAGSRARAADRLRGAGLGRHVGDYEHALRIVERADHPALGTCIDSFHVLSRGDRLRRLPAEKLFFVQLADAPRLDMGVLPWSRHHRCFPAKAPSTWRRSWRRCSPPAAPGRSRWRSSTTSSARPTPSGPRSTMALRALDGSLPDAPELDGFAYVEIAGRPPFAHEAIRVVGGDSRIAGFGVVSADRNAPGSARRSFPARSASSRAAHGRRSRRARAAVRRGGARVPRGARAAAVCGGGGRLPDGLVPAARSSATASGSRSMRRY